MKHHMVDFSNEPFNHFFQKRKWVPKNPESESILVFFEWNFRML